MLNKKAFRYLIALLFMAAAFACAKAPQGPTFDEKFNKLEVGQTTDQVQTLLGPAVLREVVDGKEIWHYKLDDPRNVVFKDKKVTSFYKEAPVVIPQTFAPGSNLVSVPEASKKIGDDCQNDKECQSLSCHFKTCVGKNNCSRNIGQTCGNDSDCCSSFCDFAICKKKP